MLATPGPNGDAVLEGAVLRAASAGLVGPRGHVVVLQQIGEDYALKVRGCGSGREKWSWRRVRDSVIGNDVIGNDAWLACSVPKGVYREVCRRGTCLGFRKKTGR
jgi:hypothetical protein